MAVASRTSRTWLSWALVVGVSLVATCVWWFLPLAKSPPDGYWIIRNALIVNGYSNEQATATTWEWRLPLREEPGQDATSEPAPVEFFLSIPSRYAAIFESRPGTSIILAPFLRIAGPAALPWFAIFWSTAAGVLVATLAGLVSRRPLAAHPVQAMVVTVSFFLLPTGYWASRLLYEGPGYACALALVVMTLLAITPTRRARLIACLLGPVALVGLSVKSSMLIPVTVSLCAISIVALFPKDRKPLASRVVTAMAASSLGLGLAVWQGIVWWRSWPGLSETLQDTFTKHFAKPDVPDPYERWMSYLRVQTGRLVESYGGYWLAAAVVVALLGFLVWRTRWRSVFGLLFLGVGASNYIVHPMFSQAARLVAPLWIPVAMAIGILLADVAVQISGRRSSARLTPGIANRETSSD